MWANGNKRKKLMLYGDWGVNACFICGTCLGQFEALFIECFEGFVRTKPGDFTGKSCTWNKIEWMHIVWDDEIAIAPLGGGKVNFYKI